MGRSLVLLGWQRMRKGRWGIRDGRRGIRNGRWGIILDKANKAFGEMSLLPPRLLRPQNLTRAIKKLNL